MVFFYVVPILKGSPKGLEKAFRHLMDCESLHKRQVLRENNEFVSKARLLYENKRSLPGRMWKARAKEAEPWIQQELKMRQKKKASEEDDRRADAISEMF